MSGLTISRRGVDMPSSPIRKLAPYAEAAKQRGIHVYHLNIGQPDIETPPSILDKIRDTDIKILGYGPSEGYYSYRQKMTEYYKRYDIDVTAEDILITTGGSEALQFGFWTCFDPEDEVIIPEPFYANYEAFASAASVKVVPVTSTIETGFALPSMAEFEKRITPKTKGILICNPNNPTGYLYSKEELESLRDLVKKYHLFLFSDEAYREFCYSGTHYSAMRLEGIEQNVILFDTVSKRYSACGARIGAFVTKNHTVLEAVLKFAQARLCPPSLEQLLGEAAIDLPANYFDATKSTYRQRRDALVEGLNKIPGVKCPKPEGAFYAMAQLPVDDTDDFCQWILEKFQYENATIMMAPGSGFYETDHLGKNEVRLAYVLNINDIQAALVCLQRGLETYNNK